MTDQNRAGGKPRREQGRAFMLTRRTLLTSTAAATLAGRAFARAQTPSEVVVGALFPLSGAAAQIGVDARAALETAVEIVNNAHAALDLPLAKSAGLQGLGGAKIRLV